MKVPRYFKIYQKNSFPHIKLNILYYFDISNNYSKLALWEKNPF
jgi:hypothetical protein